MGLAALGVVAVGFALFQGLEEVRNRSLRITRIEELLEVPAPRGTEAQRISGLHPSIIAATCHAAAAAWHQRPLAFAPAPGQTQGYGARTL